MDQGQEGQAGDNGASAPAQDAGAPIPAHSEFENQQQEVSLDIESLG